MEIEKRDSKGRFAKGNKEGAKFTTGGEQAETARKGGKASQKAQAERKRSKDILIELLDIETTDENGVERTNKELINIALINRAKKGDVRAWDIIHKMIGEDIDKEKKTGGWDVFDWMIK